jgi:hypothetical protein
VTKSGVEQALRFGVLLRPQSGLGRQRRDGTPLANFSDKQGGFSVGGKIVENKAFFFGNADWGRDRRRRASASPAADASQAFRGNEADVDRVLSILSTKYGYTIPNAKDQFSRTTNSDKFIGKADFNLRPNLRLTVRHNSSTA